MRAQPEPTREPSRAHRATICGHHLSRWTAIAIIRAIAAAAVLLVVFRQALRADLLSRGWAEP